MTRRIGLDLKAARCRERLEREVRRSKTRLLPPAVPKPRNHQADEHQAVDLIEVEER